MALGHSRTRPLAYFLAANAPAGPVRPFLFLLATLSAAAQPASVSGVVRDEAGATVAGANVYLSGTTRGDATDADGRFEIAGVPAGAYRLAASRLGYAPAAEPVRLAPGERAVVDLVLAEAPVALGAVAVEAERDRQWERRLARFRRALLGESANADSTAILNPQVLDFRDRWGELSATARAPLVIENRALGYRLTYDLAAFTASATRVSYDGDERFEEMAPTSAGEAERWAEARARAYRGSAHHLLRAMLAGTAEAEGFALELVWEDARGARPAFRTSARAVMDRDSAGWGTLRVRDQLDVTYRGEPEEPAYLRSEWFRERRRRPASVQRSSLVVARGGARIDPQGTPEDPFAVSTMGHMAFERLADRVPEDYRPPP